MQAMIIDDSRVTRMILAQILKALGFDVAEASNGADGLDRLKERSPPSQVALVDCNMPGLNGVDVIRAVRADPALRPLRLLMVTGENDETQVRLALDAGADGWIRKPFTRDQIQNQMQSMGLLVS